MGGSGAERSPVPAGGTVPAPVSAWGEGAQGPLPCLLVSTSEMLPPQSGHASWVARQRDLRGSRVL